MEHEQINLAAQFPKLIDALRSPKLGGAGCSEQTPQNCNIPNVHIGVISSDLGAGNYGHQTCEVQNGDQGKLQTLARVAGCTPPSDPWISFIEGQTNVPNGSGDPVQDVKDAFACIAQLGTGGCGFEAQLESARRALDPALNVNPGFIRPGAYLAVIFITDEDDCSAVKPQLFDPAGQGLTDPLGPLQSFRCTEFGVTCDKGGRQPGPRKNCQPGQDWLYKVEDYARFFSEIKSPGRVIMSAISGPVEPFEVGLEDGKPNLKPSCQSPTGFAVPAVRIQALVEHPLLEQLGHRGFFNPAGITICSPDFGPAMKHLGEVIVATLGGQCITSPPLTAAGSIACHAGDDLGAGVMCNTSCLDKFDCIIDQVTGQGTAGEQSVLVEKCPSEIFDPGVKDCGGSCPCWRIIPKTECDPANGSPYGLEILREGNVEADKGTVAIARCATSQFKWGDPKFTDLPQCN